MSEFDAAHAAGFLRFVYADQPGYIQICSTGSWTGRSFPTTHIDDAVAYATDLDAHQPAGIYFRATTLKAPLAEGKRGGAADTLAVPMLWGDVDHGTVGHRAANLPATSDDGHQVMAESGMPYPAVLVHSGGGWYPLWTLTGVTVEQAAELSVRVQNLLLVASHRHGWQYGTGVGDLARVLRLPGSVNRKMPDNPRLCRAVGGTGAPITPSVIPMPDPEALKAAAATGSVTANLPERKEHVPNGTRSGPLDVLADTMTWAEVLEPAGWTLVAVEPGGSERWLRPGGADSEYSARAFENNLVCHSESAGLPSGAGQRLTKGRVYAHLHYAGDVSEAAKDLVRVAHGTGVAKGQLPPHTLDAIRVSHDPWAGITTAPPSAASLAGMVRVVLRAPADDRERLLAWAGRKLSGHVAAGRLDGDRARSLVEQLIAAVRR